MPGVRQHTDAKTYPQCVNRVALMQKLSPVERLEPELGCVGVREYRESRQQQGQAITMT